MIIIVIIVVCFIMIAGILHYIKNIIVSFVQGITTSATEFMNPTIVENPDLMAASYVTMPGKYCYPEGIFSHEVYGRCSDNDGSWSPLSTDGKLFEYKPKSFPGVSWGSTKPCGESDLILGLRDPQGGPIFSINYDWKQDKNGNFTAMRKLKTECKDTLPDTAV